jgi:hypothetical protein
MLALDFKIFLVYSWRFEFESYNRISTFLIWNGLHLSKFGKLFKSKPCRGIKISFDLNQIHWFKFHSHAKSNFEFQKDIKIFLYRISFLWKYSNFPFNSNHESNSNFHDPKSFVWNPNYPWFGFQNPLILILEPKFKFLFLEKFKLRFGIQNPFKSIWIDVKTANIFKSGLKPSF